MRENGRNQENRDNGRRHWNGESICEFTHAIQKILRSTGCVEKTHREQLRVSLCSFQPAASFWGITNLDISEGVGIQKVN
jgi:hypothetical protein